MYQTILVPTDGSDGASAAVREAVALADEFGAAVHALHVAAMEDEDYADVHVDGVVEDLDPDGQEALQEAQRIGRERDVDVVTEVKGGDAARNILGFAERNDVDLIVMGTRGRSGIRRAVMGSVSEDVVRQSDVPVVVVPAERVEDDDGTPS